MYSSGMKTSSTSITFFFSAKHFIAILPFAYLGFMSLMSLLAQYSVGAWLVYNKVEKKESEIDELKEGDFQF